MGYGHRVSSQEADSSLPGNLLSSPSPYNSLYKNISSLVYLLFHQRIVEIKSLVTATENAVLTSSIDRSIKVWNLDYIFEKEHHIDKHELTIGREDAVIEAYMTILRQSQHQYFSTVGSCGHQKLHRWVLGSLGVH